MNIKPKFLTRTQWLIFLVIVTYALLVNATWMLPITPTMTGIALIVETLILVFLLTILNPPSKS